MFSIYRNGYYDSAPSWLKWSINGYEFADPIEVMGEGIRLESFSYFPKVEQRIDSELKINLSESLCRAARETLEKASGRHLAILVSGRDSELVARTFKSVGASFTVWYADYPFKNPLKKKSLRILEQLAIELGVDLKVISISLKDFIDTNYEFSEITGVAEPALGGLSTLICQIPSNHYVVLGDGDVAKDPRRYNGVHNPSRYPEHGQLVAKWGDSERLLPFIIDEVMYRIWAQKKKRFGNFCFFQSDLNMITAFLQDPDLLYDSKSGYISLKNVYRRNFPEILFKEKTDPFLHPEKGELKNQLRAHLRLRFGEAYNEQGMGSCWLKSHYLK